MHVVFEEGTQAQWLHDVLKPHAERVIVCNSPLELTRGPFLGTGVSQPLGVTPAELRSPGASSVAAAAVPP